MIDSRVYHKREARMANKSVIGSDRNLITHHESTQRTAEKKKKTFVVGICDFCNREANKLRLEEKKKFKRRKTGKTAELS